MNKQGWEVKKLSNIANVYAGQSAPKNESDFGEEGILFIRAGHLEQLIEGKKFPLSKISSEKAKKYKLKLYPRDSILFAKSGMSATLNRIYKLQVDSYVVSHLAIIVPDKTQVSASFLKYFLISYKPSSLIKDSSYPSISLPDIKGIDILTPSISIQNQIVKELDTLQAIITKKKAQLVELDKLAQATFYEMFGDPVENERNWVQKKLKDLGTLGRGISKHRPRNAPELLGGNYPLIQTGDVANTSLYISKYIQTYSEKGLKQSRLWVKGTLCITIAANIAKTAILSFDSCFPDSIVGFINNNETNIIFIHYWFSFFQKILEEQAPEVAQKNINLKILNELVVITPPCTLQNQFAKRIEAIEKQKALINQSISETQLLFDSAMDNYFN